MKNYQTSINVDHQVQNFEVSECPHQNGESCKVKVFRDGKLVVSFQPDEYNYLQVCQNPAQLDQQLLHLMAAQIEEHPPQGMNKDFKNR